MTTEAHASRPYFETKERVVVVDWYVSDGQRCRRRVITCYIHSSGGSTRI